MPSTLFPLAPYESPIISLMHEAGQINASIKELTDARDQCKAERNALNEAGGYEGSPEHLESEAKYLQVESYNRHIKAEQEESARLVAKLVKKKERIETIAKEIETECDDNYHYTLWPLGDCNCLLPQAQIFVKSMREEKDREQFLQDELQEVFPVDSGIQIPPPASMGVEKYKKVLITKSFDVLRGVVKNTKELQDDGVFPTDGNSHDRARTSKRVSNVCMKITGKAPDLKDIKKQLESQGNKGECHQCGHKEVTIYCKEGGGPTKLLSEFRGAPPAHESIFKFCSEECCLRYRVQPVCKKCNNSDKRRMYDARPALSAIPERSRDVLAKDYHCNDCRVRCYSRGPSVWIAVDYATSILIR